MADVIQNVRQAYRLLLQNDSQLSQLKDKLIKGDLSALQKYSMRAGQLAVNALQESVSNESIDQSSIQNALDGVFRENYDAVVNASSAAQKALNQNSGIGLNASDSDYSGDNVQALADKIISYDDLNEGLSNASNDIVMQSQRYADDSERRSAQFDNDSGLEVLVSREYDDVGVHTTDKGGGQPCQWCLDRCGTDVPYEEAYERGMFERHPGCGCIITYKTKKGIFRQGKGDWQDNSWSEDGKASDRIEANQRYVQDYKPVIRGEKSDSKLLNGTIIKASKIKGYDNIYVSDNAVVKPRAVHNISVGINKAFKDVGIKEKQKIVIAAQDEIKGSVARYNAVTNTMFVIPEAGEKKEVLKYQTDMAAKDDPFSTFYHETMHAKQAEDYRNAGGSIDDKSYSNYIEKLREKSKRNLDRAGIDYNNVNEISDYATDAYMYGKYDEVAAEYETVKFLKKR